MIEEQNGNNPINVKLSSSMVVPIASSQSNDDLSLSTSEYTDADEMSAPTEYLAEVSEMFFVLISNLTIVLTLNDSFYRTAVKMNKEFYAKKRYYDMLFTMHFQSFQMLFSFSSFIVHQWFHCYVINRP